MRAWQCISMVALVLSTAVTGLGRVAAAAPAGAEQARVAVVEPPWAAGDRAFVAQRQALAAPLGNMFSLVPLGDYVRAGKSLALGEQALYGDESAVRIGRLVGARYVLVLRPKEAPSKRRAERQLMAVLVDAETGASPVDLLLPLARSARLQAKNAAELMGALTASLAAAPPTSAPMAAAGLAASPNEPAAPPVGGQASTPTAAAPTAPASPNAVALAPAVVPAAPPPSPAPAPAQQAVAEPALVAPPTAVPAPPPKSAVVRPAGVVPPSPPVQPSFWDSEGRLRHGVGVSGGVLVYERLASIDAGGVSRLRYGAVAGGRAPIFVRGVFNLELYPGRWHRGPIGPAGGIGVFAQGSFGAGKTLTSSGRVVPLKSGGFRAGLLYRSPLWRGPHATAAALKVGYSEYLFASNAGVPFAPVGMRGVLLGLGLEVPLDTRHVAVVASGAAIIAPRAFGGLQNLGTAQSSALGGLADGGLRFSVGPVDLTLTLSWERYRARFFGQSHVPNLTAQYANAELVDQNFGGKAQVGLQF